MTDQTPAPNEPTPERPATQTGTRRSTLWEIQESVHDKYDERHEQEPMENY